jgi:uncharacterized DUF497 family protein
MKHLPFDSFEWDEGNKDKNLEKHGIGKEAIEALFHAQPFFTDDTRHSRQEQRFVAVGISGVGRWMMVSFTIRTIAGKRFLRPISARYMHAKEVKYYERIHQESK